MTASIGLPNLSDVLERLRAERVVERIWAADHTVWRPSPDDITNRLGWLIAPAAMRTQIDDLAGFRDEVFGEGITHAVLLGMGGSSLAPEVFEATFGPSRPPGALRLTVLDTTDAEAVSAAWASVDPARTLVIVSSKSGGTVETISLFRFFFTRMTEALGRSEAGRRFVAITDPGSGLARIGEEHSFRRVFLADPDIGGRYSALSHFGLVPAALVGVDLDALLSRAEAMSVACGVTDSLDDNPGVWLGAVLGEHARAGRDKLTLVLSPAIASFAGWIEQLIAESTGKEGKGILPVAGEMLAPPDRYAQDRVFVHVVLEGDQTHATPLAALAHAGHPVVEVRIPDRVQLGGEFFRWEMATAVACERLGVNPFDQPNVEAAKVLSKALMDEYLASGRLPDEEPACRDGGLIGYADSPAASLEAMLAGWLADARPGDYVAIQAYVPPSPEDAWALEALRERLRAHGPFATTTGFGPRFLHSTGQLHKGDAGNGLFLQLVGGPAPTIGIPDTAGETKASVTFDVLKRAQALGDRRALRKAGRRMIGVDLGADVPGGLSRLVALVRREPAGGAGTRGS